MNLGGYIREVEARTGFTDGAFQERWRRYINAAIRDFARSYPWPGLERELSTTLLSGERYLVLPGVVDHVTSILNTTDRAPIRPHGNWDRQEPAIYSNLTQGRPQEYQMAGHVATIRDPSGFVWFKSSHASDVDSLFISGFASASGSSDPATDTILQTVSVEAQGVSPVTLGTQFSQIISVSKATRTNGDFFFFDADGGEYVSFIPASGQDARFRRLEFLFVPDADKSVRIKYIPEIPYLTDDAQSPHPTVKDDYVIERAISIFQRYQSQYQKGAFHDNEAQRILADETDAERNFGEPESFIQPDIPGTNNSESDNFRGWF